jgi:hypothetical protein
MMNFKRSQRGYGSFAALPRHLHGSTEKVIKTSIRITDLQTKTPTADHPSKVVTATATWYRGLLLPFYES